ncbi:secretion system protein [Occultella glacieicola]|uniref:Secretion system protein n=1 Tax=Occultella glacieicola TaxID=2518684 RepID=A0ABY2E340_9MICO|nr:type II secretion system F family protein [Occultella glacieicola]TDE89252.1 secretion system protein [Occultella glacieicola]
MSPAWLAAALLVLASLPWAVRRPRVAHAPPARPGPATEPGERGRFRWWRGQRRPTDPVVDPAVVLDLLDATLAAGVSIPAALDALGQALPATQGEPLRRVAGALRLGADWDQAWQGTDDSWAAVSRALAPAWCDGVAPGAGLRQAAEGIRARRGASAREAAARLGVQLVLPLGLCLLPAFVLLGLVPVLLSTGVDLLGP